MKPSRHQQDETKTNSHKASAKQCTFYFISDSILRHHLSQEGDSKTEKADCRLNVSHPFACYPLRYFFIFIDPAASHRHWSWREEFNLQPVVYKRGKAESAITQEDQHMEKAKNRKSHRHDGLA